ncbi:ribonuclease P protein subunit p29 [Microcaecilia unicolor]|uniref:Ribonuclease P protein subunit p29 n=1 Tax=Microcaecilia unicolor TaxID=1415580 RepID=A0A6P7Y4T0_9AMPH|nr:ribonuclease P protein subunit p29 [Microcaecilia unicolor]XP_030059911.1 ribonuclease P protein subunit p29 [Microcaecilia unicolor]XP_030059912.1 ribonuclease P protein subunit p29 [Microcaecilia unicolor]XP_030059913.1 ribonuclease P protein subunit p29 [Microcaecilia unicolor]
MEGVIYKTLSSAEAKELNIQTQGPKESEAFVSAFLKRCLPGLREEVIQERLNRKAVILEHSVKQKKKQKRKRRKGLSAKEKRQLRLFEIKAEQQRYNLFLPLHNLWKQYIRDLCNGLRADTQPQMIQTKLLKADLHGSLVTVKKSKCPSYVGLSGIIVQETKHIFKIITKDDKLKAVPKCNTVFSVEVDDFISYIYGSRFQLRSSERSAKKFKMKGSIDL